MTSRIDYIAALDKAFEQLRGEALLDAPVHALAGVTPADAATLLAHFGVQSIRDLANNQTFLAAQAKLAEARASGSTVRAGVHTLPGVTQEDEDALHAALQIRSVQSMGENRFFLLARAMLAEAAQLAADAKAAEEARLAAEAKAAEDARLAALAAEAARAEAAARAAEIARQADADRLAEIERRKRHSTITFINVADDDVRQFRTRSDLTRDFRVDSASPPNTRVSIGDHDGDVIMQYVFGFELPALPPTLMVTDVDLAIELMRDPKPLDEATIHNADLWIVGFGKTITPHLNWQLGPAGVGPGGVLNGACLVEANVFTPRTPLGLLHVRDSARVALRDAINVFYDSQKGSDLPYGGGTRVYLRLNCDRPPPGGPFTSGYFVPGSGSLFPQRPAKMALFVG